MFDSRFAQRSLRRYVAKGLDRIERSMVDSALEGGLEGARVLEIGGGIGKLQIELLEAGAECGEVIELVPAFEPYARELARDRGLEERTSFRVVDVLEEPRGVAPADIVLLNRVICCSPDGIALTGAAAHLAQRTLILSYPRDTVWIRGGIRLMNIGFRIMGRSFRAFAHSRIAIREVAEAAGLRTADSAHTIAWEFVTFRRAA
jgi:magnesium-protoporphyrin O-methyltransferase